MYQRRQGIDLVSVDEDIKLYERAFVIAFREVVKRGIPARNRFQFVLKIEDNFSKRDGKSQLYPLRRQVYLVLQFAPFADAEVHHGPDVFAFGDDLSLDIWLFYSI